MRSVIVEDRRWEGGPLVENPEFVRFAHHWQFRARACRPYRARTKGKIERPIRYVRDNFVYGREFLNDEDLDAQLERWLREVANVRHHRTIHQRPIERFEREERTALGPLAERPYRSLVLPAQPTPRRKAKGLVTTRTFGVERRSLVLYDRILHHCHIINIRGNSYRMREHSELWQVLHPAGSDEPCPPANARKKSPECRRLRVRHPIVECAIFTHHKCPVFGRR